MLKFYHKQFCPMTVRLPNLVKVC